MNLSVLQQLLCDAMVQDKHDPTLDQYIHADAALTTTQRLAIYRDSILGTFTRALAITYPVCKKLVGVAFFDAMAKCYFKETSPSGTDDSTAHFSNFIANYTPAKSLPYLYDVAALEWAYEQAEESQDTLPLNFTAMNVATQAHANSLHFHLPKSASMITSAYPLLAIWEMCQPDNRHIKPPSLDQGGEHLIIFRRDFTMHIDRLNKNEWQFLKTIQDKPFIAACEEMEEIDIIALLPRAIAHGWIESFST